MKIDEIDHSGEVHKRLTLLRKGEPYIAPKNGKKKQRYYCSCSCGRYTENNPKLIVYESIKSGLVQSCGCLKSELMIKSNKDRARSNQYDLSGDFGIGYTIKGEEFYFDLEDYEKIKDYHWYLTELNYVITVMGRRKVYMHNIIMSPSKNYFIDHINHNPNNNRKRNLRLVTFCQNQMNKRKQSNNTSGIVGVSWDKRRNKWTAYITVNKKRIYLGYFDAFENAVTARKEAEEKYFGEYSYDNSMKIGETENVYIS